MTDEIYNTKEAAPRVGTSPGMLSLMRHQRRGPKYILVGKAVRYRASDLKAYLDARTVDPALPLPQGVERARGGPGRGHRGKMSPRKMQPERGKRARRS